MAIPKTRSLWNEELEADSPPLDLERFKTIMSWMPSFRLDPKLKPTGEQKKWLWGMYDRTFDDDYRCDECGQHVEKDQQVAAAMRKKYREILER